MRILFVLSQIEVTGSETYAITLASALRNLGHEVVFVSDKLRDPSGFRFYPLPIHARNTSTLGRIRNVRAVARILRDEKIDVIHSHSRAANLVSHFARGRTPMVTTMHARWRMHFALRVLPCRGDRTIAVCPLLARYLSEEVGIPSSAVRVIPNGIDVGRFSPTTLPSGKEKRLCYVGRFSGQKGNVIRHLIRTVFPELSRREPRLSVKIFSFSIPSADLDKIGAFNSAAGREFIRVESGGGPSESFYRDADAVVGSGRVAMEAMACGRPVVAIGESSAPGLVTPQSLDSAFDSNFGDFGEWNLFEKGHRILEDLLSILDGEARAAELGRWGREAVLERFDMARLAPKVLEVYREAQEAAS